MKRNQTYHQTFFMNVKKNVPWHILAPSAVACDMFLLRASAHPRGAFFIHRTQFPMNKIKSDSPDSRTEVRLH